MVSFEESAKVYRITGRKYDTALRLSEKLSVEDFEYVFEKEVQPNIILEDHVSLYILSQSEAVYVDCGDIDVFGDTIYPFTYEAQYKAAKKLIILPINSFHQISETIVLPDIPMCYLFHHGRCGSTLLSNSFAAIPGALVVCDTKSLFDIAIMSSKGEATEIELKQLLKSTFLNYVKHANLRKSKLFFTKQSSMCTFVADLTMDVFPSVKYVFMYRQPIQFVESRQKLIGLHEIKNLTSFACVYNSHSLMSDVPSYSINEIKSLSLYAQIGWKWINVITAYNALIERGYQVKSLKYEDFLSNPRKMMSTLASYMNACMPAEVNFEEVLTKDSQKGSKASTRGLSSDQLKKYLTPLTNEVRQKLDELCGHFNVPRFLDDVKLSNPLQSILEK